MPYPWDERGGLMPWQVGTPMVGSDGQVYTAVADPSSPTGYSVTHTDQYGTDTRPVNAPVNPTAGYDYLQGTSYGKTLTAAEQAAATQNQFNQNLQRDTLGVSQASQKQTAAYQQALVEQAKKALAFQYYQQDQNNQIAQGNLGVAQGNLDVNRGQLDVSRGTLGMNTLQLGASLHGPRNWDDYLNTVGMAGSNPIIQGAMGTWADLTNNRPKGTGAYQGSTPQTFDLNALAGDFMGASGGTQGTTSGPTRNPFLDDVARSGQAAPGWWSSLSPDMQERAQGYWENTGQSPSTVLSRLAWTGSGNKGLGYAGA